MNLRIIKDWHERKAVELSRSRKSVAARAHALRALQIEKVLEIRREVRGQLAAEKEARS